MESSGESPKKLVSKPVIIKEELADEITDQDLQTNSCVSFANEVFGDFRVAGETLWTHTNQRPHVCRICEKSYNEKYQLTKHLRTHSGVKPYSCRECGQGFSFRTGLKQHMSSHTGIKPFSCDVCGKHFSRKNNLKRHSVIHTGEKPYTCDKCQKSFTQPSSLKSHVRLHTGEKPYECRMCGKFFAQKSTRNVHIARCRGRIKHVLKDSLQPELKHPEIHQKGEVVQVPGEILNNSIYACAGATEGRQIAEKTFVTNTPNFLDDESVNCGKDATERSEQLSDHNSGDELSSRGEFIRQESYLCRECGEDFTSKSALQIHMYICPEPFHTAVKPFVCNLCGKNFAKKCNLKRHSIIHTGQKPYSCDNCQKRFTQQSSLKAHIRLHTGEKPFECRACGKFFTQSSTLHMHMKRHHSGIKQVFVEDSMQPDLEHSEIHPEGEVVQFPGEIPKNSILACAVPTEEVQQIVEETFVTNKPNFTYNDDDDESVNCGKDAMEQSEQISDPNSEHELTSSGEIVEQESYLCRECGEDFKSKRALQIHKKIHSNVGPFICPVSSHTGIKPFICDLCGKHFAQKCNLKRHSITHTGQKPYSCDKCQKRFTQQSTLKAHIRLHTGEKPYGCKTCGKFFTQSSTLNVHIARRHGGKKQVLEDSPQPDLKHSEIHPEGGEVVQVPGENLKNSILACVGATGEVQHIVEETCVTDMTSFTDDDDESVNCGKEAIGQSEQILDPNSGDELSSSGEFFERESYLCRECGEDFTSKRALQIHKKIHSDVGPFICPGSSHTGIKPFICDLCGKHFAQKCNLKRHSITHTGQKPYSCDTCQKRFTQQSTLKAHIRLHTGETPYECKTCGKFFTQSSTLNVHIARRHGGKKHVLEDSLQPDLKLSEIHPEGGEVVQVPGQILKNSILACAGATGEVQQIAEGTFVTDMPNLKDDNESVNCRKDAMEQTEQILVRNSEDELALAGELVKQESYLCPECDEIFPTKPALQIHKNIHRDVGPFICPECGQCFSLHADLSQHMSSHTGVRPFICDLCGKHFAQKCNLKRHSLTHTGKKPYSCDKCQKRFTQQSSLKAHIRLHTGEKPFECRACGKFFTQSSTLHVHITRHHSGMKHKVLGDSSKSGLKHSKIHPRGEVQAPGKIQENSIFACTGSSEVNQIAEKTSVTNMTGDEESLDCSKCVVEQSEEMSLHNYKDEIVSPGEIVSYVQSDESYASEDCGRNFQLRQDMLKHKQIQASVAIASNLKCHTRLQCGLKPYACSNCEKSFARKADLDRHVRIHTGQKPYKCFECGRSFTQLGTLNSHLRIHTGEKPHLCITCGRRFVQRTALIVHMRTHNGIRPYVCHECGKGFSVRSALKRHAEIHSDDHNEKNNTLVVNCVRNNSKVHSV